jgi:EasF-like predicted methyltransferase
MKKEDPHWSFQLTSESRNMKKTVLILSTLQSQRKSITYIACDVDRVAVQRGIRYLQSLFPPTGSSGIRIQGLIATYEDCASWLQRSPINGTGSRTTLMWLGNSMANYTTSPAASYIRSFLSTGASLIVAVDGSRDEAEIARAYEGPANQKFVLNGLAHANELLGSQVFDPRDWSFRGRWNEETWMHESFYVAERDLVVTIWGERFEFKKGDVMRSIRSGKWPRSKMVSVCEEAGGAVVDYWTDEKESYGMSLKGIRVEH